MKVKLKVVNTDSVRVEHVRIIFRNRKRGRKMEFGNGLLLAHFGSESFSDFFPFFAEASSSVKVGKFCLFGVMGRGLNSATTGVEPRGSIVCAFLTVRSGGESSCLLLRFRDGVVGTGGRGEVESIAGKDEDFACCS